MKGILECCVDSVESAIAAKNGGADRLELCQGLVIGGVTPGTALFQEIKNQMDIRIHALMRPRFGDFCYTRHEIDILCEDIRTFRKQNHLHGTDTRMIQSHTVSLPVNNLYSVKILSVQHMRNLL